jgi:hypothetical protein
MRWPGFSGPTYQAQSPKALVERAMNLMPERVEMPNGKTDLALVRTPGLRTFATAPEIPGRGIFAQAGRCFAALGTALYDIAADGTKTNLGALAVDQYPATLVTNGDGGGELFVTSGRQGYLLNLDTLALSSVVANVTMADMLDGYFVALDIDTSTMKISDLLDGGTWDPTQIAQRTLASDPWKALIVVGTRIWLFGETTTEIWYDTGGAFPFSPVPGLLIPYGIKAPFSAKRLGSSVIWISQNEHGAAQIIEAQGYNPQRISTHAVEWAMHHYARIDNAVAFTYQDNGHEFYEVNFDEGTWVYDKTVGLWHERGHFDATMGTYGPWGPQYHAYAFNKHLVLDSETGVIHEMSSDVYTDRDGSMLRWERIPPALFTENKRIFLDELELVTDAGLGLVTGQGSDPTIGLQVSFDGGRTWGSERWRSTGALGEYGRRCRWIKCGSGRDPLPKFFGTDPVPVRLVDLIATAAPGAH